MADAPTDLLDPAGGGPPDDAAQARLRYGIGLTLGAVIVVVVVYVAREAFLLGFLGVAVGVAFFRASRWLATHTGLPRGLLLALVVLLTFGTFVGFGALAGPPLMEQARALVTDTPDVLLRATRSVGLPTTPDGVVEAIQKGQGVVSAVAGRLTGFLSSAAGLFAGLLVVLVVSVYTAASPESYVQGVLRLFPPVRRSAVRAVLVEISDVLAYWIYGVLAASVALGALAAVGLSVLGLPAVFLLAGFVALLTAIPNFGPFIGWAPALLVGFAQGPTTGLWTLALAAVAQQLEGSVLTPMIQRKMVHVGAATIIVGQVVLGTFAGVLGILLAVPLLGVGGVLVRRLYIGPRVPHTSGDPVD